MLVRCLTGVFAICDWELLLHVTMPRAFKCPKRYYDYSSAPRQSLYQDLIQQYCLLIVVVDSGSYASGEGEAEEEEEMTGVEEEGGGACEGSEGGGREGEDRGSFSSRRAAQWESAREEQVCRVCRIVLRLFLRACANAMAGTGMGVC
eukprot:1457439-Rhodomonas_salina.1